MSKIGYSYQKEKDGIVKAIARGARISPKQSYEIAKAIRGKKVSKAKSFLSRVISMKQAVQYTKYNRGGTGHRKGKLGPGRYPLKASKHFLKLLNELEANAEFKGMNTSNLILEHVAVKRGEVIQGRYKGGAHNTPTTHIEFVAKESEQKETKKEKQKEKTEEKSEQRKEE